MANVVEKFGLRPYKNLNGASWNNAQNRYTIANNYGTAIFQGDMVIPVTAGNIERHTAGNATQIVGVFNGCFYSDPTTKKPTFSNHYPGSIAADDIVANVIDDPSTLFLIDADERFERSDLFTNYSVTNVTGNTDTGISKVQLDVSATSTSFTFALMAVDISQDPNNSDVSAGTTNNNVIVRIQNHFYQRNNVADTGV